jgi:hypothetical protein
MKIRLFNSWLTIRLEKDDPKDIYNPYTMHKLALYVDEQIDIRTAIQRIRYVRNNFHFMNLHIPEADLITDQYQSTNKMSLKSCKAWVEQAYTNGGYGRPRKPYTLDK